jgi:AmmeMemoRadiSam system protein B
LEADRIVPEAAEHQNACGAGAVAATVAAARKLGAQEGILLSHITSAEVMGAADANDSVGYAGIVFAKSFAG